jgi:hypothetical protein
LIEDNNDLRNQLEIGWYHTLLQCVRTVHIADRLTTPQVSLSLVRPKSGMVMRAMRPVSQPRQVFLPVATSQACTVLVGYPIAFGDLNNGKAVIAYCLSRLFCS